MILNIILLLIVLSLESTIGLPIFFVYLTYRLISRRKEREQVIALFVMSLLLAIFYSISWPLLSLLVFIFHLAWQKFTNSKPFGKLLVFVLFNLLIFAFGRLQLNYFYIIHFLAFLFYFYKANFKNYAA